MIKRSLWVMLGISLILACGCQPKKKGDFSVSGTFRNADKLAAVEGPISKVYLLELVYGTDQPPVVLDSAKIPVSNGSFSLSGTAKSQGLMELVFGNNALAVPLINDASDIKVKVDLGKNDDFYEVSGSEASSQLKDLITIFGIKNFEMERTMAHLDSLKQVNAPDSTLLAATAKKNGAIRDLNVYLKQFINTNGDATISALALGWSRRSFSKPEFESSLDDLVKKYPENSSVQAIKQSYDLQKAQAATQEQQQGNSWIGKPAPAFSLPDASGKSVSLASFRGKYLLVDFWASWCGPCRAENPNVVRVHDEFKGKNFAILGVSLDKEKGAWEQAIQEDKLNWTQVSDLKYWNTKAVEVFKFDGIPFNVLIDPQGNVIAQGLRGDELESKLKQVLN
jgi:peroxiredoxin